MKIIGIDPGTGRSSPTGLCCIDPEKKNIYFTGACGSSQHSQHFKFIELTGWLENKLRYVMDSILGDEEPAMVCIENFVMRGKGGETLQRLIGAYISHTPSRFYIETVHNTTMKRLISGSGDGDKKAVAVGLLRYFKSNDESIQILTSLIHENQWDILDSIGLAVAGYMQSLEEKPVTKPTKKRRV